MLIFDLDRLETSFAICRCIRVKSTCEYSGFLGVLSYRAGDGVEMWSEGAAVTNRTIAVGISGHPTGPAIAV